MIDQFNILTIRFLNQKGERKTDWEHFDIAIHRSGTVAVEVGRLTHYTFRQQIADIVRIDSVLNVLHPTESDEHFGSFTLEYKNDSETISQRACHTLKLVEFVESVICQIDERFHDQCREIIDSYRRDAGSDSSQQPL
jgi:hypothetical protein